LNTLDGKESGDFGIPIKDLLSERPSRFARRISSAFRLLVMTYRRLLVGRESVGLDQHTIASHIEGHNLPDN
jgi:hypothetical protein